MDYIIIYQYSLQQTSFTLNGEHNKMYLTIKSFSEYLSENIFILCNQMANRKISKYYEVITFLGITFHKKIERRSNSLNLSYDQSINTSLKAFSF